MPTSLPTVGTIRLGEKSPKNIDNFEQSTALIINRVEVSLSLCFNYSSVAFYNVGSSTCIMVAWLHVCRPLPLFSTFLSKNLLFWSGLPMQCSSLDY